MTRLYDDGMSCEYYARPPVRFDEAMTKLLASLGDSMEVIPCPSRYVPECEAVAFSTGSASFWALRETRPSRLGSGSPGCLVIEVLGRNLDLVGEFMPWVEAKLEVEMVDELGLGWRDDVTRL